MLHPTFALLGWFSLSLAGYSQDWPEFRGPTGQGLATAASLPLEWSETNHVAWKQAIPGRGWSSPSLKADRIYLTTAVAASGGGSSGALGQQLHPSIPRPPAAHHRGGRRTLHTGPG